MSEEAFFIEQYLKGNLKPNELKNFTQRLNTDANLRSKVEDYKVIYSGLEILEEQSFLQKVQQWEQHIREEEATNIVPIQPSKTEGGRIFRLRPLLSVAASTILLLGLGLTWFANDQYSNQSLVKNSYEAPYTGMIASDKSGKGSEGDLSAIPLKEGIELFQQKKYAQAAKFFDAIPTSNAAYVQAQYFLGHSYYQQKAYPKAIEKFATVEKEPSYSNAEKASWDKILAMLAAEYPKAVIENELEAILQDKKHIAFESAQTLQKQLDSGWRWFVF